MTELIPDIRNAARALIIREGKVLLLRKEGGGRGERFALPGGAQDPGESLQEALNRECEEEIGTSVNIGNLLHVVDFFKLRDTQPPTRRHLVEFLFQCSIDADYLPCNGHRPDKHQVEVIWADLNRVANMPLFPQYLSTCIPHQADRALYLGTFNDHAIT
ncbi:MAG: NUDIX domain-containing protein [Candidatus Sedimenticola sp. PURPLELP]